jgi:hypothetical protein
MTILYPQTSSSSPWTETVKVPAGSTYDVDPTRVLPIFQPKSVDLQKTIPHDHAMILTKYIFHFISLKENTTIHFSFILLRYLSVIGPFEFGCLRNLSLISASQRLSYTYFSKVLNRN